MGEVAAKPCGKLAAAVMRCGAGGMRIKILGCSGGIGAGLRTTSLLVDEDILVDTGTGIGDLPLAELRRIRHVFLTHSHLDHTCGLPLLLDTVFDTLQSPIMVRGREETLAAVRKHIFNWVMWPDFAELPNREAPALQYGILEPGERVTLGDRTLEAVAVIHSVPAVGYIIEADGAVFAFSGDTGPNDSFWQVLNGYAQVNVLVIECAFPNRNAELAELARHYCPRTLAADLPKLRHTPEIWLTHLKPGAEEEIFAEIQAALPERRVQRLRGGEVFEL